MKRVELVRLIRDHGCVLLREGKKHSIYIRVQTGKFTPIPRHKEINEWSARKILKDLGIQS